MIKQSVIIFLIILSGALFLIIGTHFLDVLSQGDIQKEYAPLFFFYSIDTDSVLAFIGSLAEVMTALFGIILTVVAIIVNLSANRYTSKVIDLFIRDRFNVSILVFYGIISFYSIWILNVLQFRDAPVEFVPRFEILIYLFLVSIGVLLIVPYFYFVFQFLTPNTIISKIKKQAQRFILRARCMPAKKSKRVEKEIKPSLVENLEQLSEICKGSLISADRSLGLLSLKTLNQILEFYIQMKEKSLSETLNLPFCTSWYTDIDRFFLGLNQSIVDNLKAHNYWFEYRICQEYESVLRHSISSESKIAYQTAINLTTIGKKAAKHQDIVLLRMIVYYFNTFLKTCITERNQQTIIDVFYQYYLLLREIVLQTFKNNSEEDACEYIYRVSWYFKHYGQLAALNDTERVLEFAAYFLRRINELSYRKFYSENPDLVHKLLNLFLTVDDMPEDEIYNEKVLVGVRQNQAILAAFYIEQNEPELTRQIRNDMLHESQERLDYIRDSILGVDEENHFEIDNIGINTLFIHRERRKALEEFFKQF